MSEAHTLAARAMRHLLEGTTDQAPTTRRVPLAAYLDEDQHAAEVQAVFHDSPIAAALSLQLPEPGSYLAQTLLGVPVLMVRGDDGEVRAFLNVCRHRGAQICAPGAGQRERFTCPYHAWTYDQTGALVHVYGEALFGEVDRAERSLVRLGCAERSGVVFVCLNPHREFDADLWLGGMQAQLDTLQLDQWVLFEERELPGAGWKATMDGYLEVYHHDIVHRATVGAHTVGNLLVHDTYGPHQRMTFARPSLRELAGLPPDEWVEPAQHIRLIHSVFPNLSASGIVGGHCLVGIILPIDLHRTVTKQFVLCAPGEQDDAWREAAEAFSDLTLRAVRDEDYALVQTVQDALASGANDDFLLGRNEPAVQHYHEMVQRLTAGASLEHLEAI